MNKEFRVLGKKTIRKDGVAKVTGREMFASDMSLPNMLYGRVLKSTHPHARVKSMNVAGAEAMGGVTLTPADVPDVMYCPRLVSIPEATYRDWRVLTDKPHYVGEPIGAVAAESEEEAQRALEAIKVEYETLSASFDALDAMKPDAEAIHEQIYLEDDLLDVESNIGCALDITEGDLKALEDADVVIERTYRTNRRYHNQLEPKSVLVRPEPDGGLSIWSTTQTIHNTRLLIHDIYGIPVGKIRVYKVALGDRVGGLGLHVHVVLVGGVVEVLDDHRGLREAPLNAPFPDLGGERDVPPLVHQRCPTHQRIGRIEDRGEGGILDSYSFDPLDG